MQNLDPQLLAQILALQNGPSFNNQINQQAWYDPNYTTDSPNGWMVDKSFGYDYAQGDGGENTRNTSKDQTYIRKVRPDTGGNLGDYWDTTGKYLGTYDALNGGGGEFNKAVALMAAGYFGGGALADAYGAAGAGGMSASQQAAMMAANGMTDAEIAAALGGTVGQGLTGAGIGTGAATAGTGAGLWEAAKTLGSGAVDAIKTVGGSGNGSLLGAGLGAVAGALDGGDKTQSSTRDPWAPAQDFLKLQLSQGMPLSQQYQQQPFSQAQKTAYANQGGLLDAINQNAGGLIGLGSANASGQNAFVRGQPRQLQGSQFNLNGFKPGLLGNLGAGG